MFENENKPKPNQAQINGQCINAVKQTINKARDLGILKCELKFSDALMVAPAQRDLQVQNLCFISFKSCFNLFLLLPFEKNFFSIVIICCCVSEGFLLSACVIQLGSENLCMFCKFSFLLKQIKILCSSACMCWWLGFFFCVFLLPFYIKIKKSNILWCDVAVVFLFAKLI